MHMIYGAYFEVSNFFFSVLNFCLKDTNHYLNDTNHYLNQKCQWSQTRLVSGPQYHFLGLEIFYFVLSGLSNDNYNKDSNQFHFLRVFVYR